MKRLSLILSLIFISLISCASEVESEKPVQHLQLPDVTSIEAAEKVFLAKTEELKNIKTFDANTLHEIHIITYSLEKSIAYYAENLKGKHKKVAEAMAEQVEHVHLNSENNRPELTKNHLSQYFALAQNLPLTR